MGGLPHSNECLGKIHVLWVHFQDTMLSNVDHSINQKLHTLALQTSNLQHLNFVCHGKPPWIQAVGGRHSVQQVGIPQTTPVKPSLPIRKGQSTTNSSSDLSRRSHTLSGTLHLI